MAAPVRVTLIRRPGCHLCDVARETVERVAADLGVVWEERSVDSDPAWLERWSDQVPVTLVDGRQHGLLAGRRDPAAGCARRATARLTSHPPGRRGPGPATPVASDRL